MYIFLTKPVWCWVGWSSCLPLLPPNMFVNWQRQRSQILKVLQCVKLFKHTTRWRGGLLQYFLLLDKRYNSVALVQSECSIRPITMIWLADTIPCLLISHPFYTISFRETVVSSEYLSLGYERGWLLNYAVIYIQYINRYYFHKIWYSINSSKYQFILFVASFQYILT